jgi:hypothetical protein
MLGQEGAALRQDTQAGARPAFFISDFRVLLFGLAALFGRKNFLHMIACATFRAWPEPAAATDKSWSVLGLRLDFTGFDCVDNCNFDKFRTSDCALIAAG